MPYEVTAGFRPDGPGTYLVVDCSTPEVLGDAYGRAYKTKREAEEIADDLQMSVEEVGLDPTTFYEVRRV